MSALKQRLKMPGAELDRNPLGARVVVYRDLADLDGISAEGATPITIANPDNGRAQHDH